MKKFIPSILVAIIFFAAGYLLHLKINDPLAAESLVGGDINKAATQSITDPEAQAELLTCRMNEFVFLTTWVLDYTKMLDDPNFAEVNKQLSGLQKQSFRAFRNGKKAYEMLASQLEGCEAFITASDNRIASFPEQDLKLASLRDLMVSFALQNAYMLDDQASIERLNAIPEQIPLTEDMIYNFSFNK